MEIVKLAREKGYTDYLWVDEGNYYQFLCGVQKWLRDKHRIIVSVELDQTSSIKYAISVCPYFGVSEFKSLLPQDK